MKQHVRMITALLVAGLLFCTGCIFQTSYVKTELYFGLCKNDVCANDSDFVPESDWEYFVYYVVTPRFGEGLTVIDSKGEWINELTGKMIWEKSKILVLLHEDKKSNTEAIEYIRDSYKKLYGQDSVMKVKSKVDVDF